MCDFRVASASWASDYEYAPTAPMSKKVLFIYLSEPTAGYLVASRRDYEFKRLPQLGFQYLAAYLRTLGVESEILDQTYHRFHFDGLLRRVREGRWYFVGFYSASFLNGKVMSYVRRLKEAGVTVPIVVGGPAFPNAEAFHRAGADIVCWGEGERTVAELIEYLDGKRSLREVKGISYLANGEVEVNERRELIEDLDSLPVPCRDLVPISAYHDWHFFTMRKPFTTIMASRGCPMRCAFCSSHRIWGGRLRLRSVDGVLAEIAVLVNKYHIRYLGFKDDIFGFDDLWLEEFCEKLAARRFRLRWMCIVHPLGFRKEPERRLSLLRKAGCDMLTFGLQSAVPDILRRIHRSPDEPRVLETVVPLARTMGFSVCVEFILGLPGETTETIRQTIDYAVRLRPNYAQFFSLAILEGSELAEQYRDEPVCGLSQAEIERWCSHALRRFYLAPRTIGRNLLYVLRHNPAWLVVAVQHSYYLLDAIGLRK